jgi:hypothetical protein
MIHLLQFKVKSVSKTAKITNTWSAKFPDVMNFQITSSRIRDNATIFPPFSLTTYYLCSSKTVLALWLHWKLLANFCGRFFFGVSAVQLRHHTAIV